MSLFKALHTLAGQCPAILVTVARDGATNLRVNVIPRAPTGGDGKTEVKDGALFTPISLTGTPDELDAGFAEALPGYVETRRDLRTAVEAAKETMQAAAKAKKPSTTLAATNAKPAVKPAALPTVAPKSASHLSSKVTQSISSADLFNIDAAATSDEMENDQF